MWCERPSWTGPSVYLHSMSTKLRSILFRKQWPLILHDVFGLFAICRCEKISLLVNEQGVNPHSRLYRDERIYHVVRACLPLPGQRTRMPESARCSWVGPAGERGLAESPIGQAQVRLQMLV
jgi:hypothetical protein